MHRARAENATQVLVLQIDFLAPRKTPRGIKPIAFAATLVRKPRSGSSRASGIKDTRNAC